MLLILMPEIPHRGDHRIGAGLPECTEGRVFHHPAQKLQQGQIGRFTLPFGDAREDGECL